jgi:hypothetical protein
LYEASFGEPYPRASQSEQVSRRAERVISLRETAYCYITDGGTKSVRETAYCYITDGGTKSARETAYCYITDGGGTTAARDSLSCYAPDVRTRPSLARYSLLAN